MRGRFVIGGGAFRGVVCHSGRDVSTVLRCDVQCASCIVGVSSSLREIYDSFRRMYWHLSNAILLGNYPFLCGFETVESEIWQATAFGTTT